MQARRRRPAAVLGVVVAFAGLTACTRPTPGVTLYSGGATVRDDAFSYCFDAQDPQAAQGAQDACRIEAERAPEVLRVRPGDTVLVDVDKDLADSGWFAALRTEGHDPVRTAVQSEEHVVRVQPDFNQGTRQFLEVRKLDGPREDARVVGLWLFVVVPE